MRGNSSWPAWKHGKIRHRFHWWDLRSTKCSQCRCAGNSIVWSHFAARHADVLKPLPESIKKYDAYQLNHAKPYGVASNILCSDASFLRGSHRKRRKRRNRKQNLNLCKFSPRFLFPPMLLPCQRLPVSAVYSVQMMQPELWASLLPTWFERWK
jgi:hypothetical protein